MANWRTDWCYDQRGAKSGGLGAECQHQNPYVHYNRVSASGVCGGKWITNPSKRTGLNGLQALFALNEGILPESAGRGLFVGLVFLFMTATFAFAILIPRTSDSIGAFRVYQREKRRLHEQEKENRKEESRRKSLQMRDARQSTDRDRKRGDSVGGEELSKLKNGARTEKSSSSQTLSQRRTLLAILGRQGQRQDGTLNV